MQSRDVEAAKCCEQDLQIVVLGFGKSFVFSQPHFVVLEPGLIRYFVVVRMLTIARLRLFLVKGCARLQDVVAHLVNGCILLVLASRIQAPNEPPQNAGLQTASPILAFILTE